MSSIAETEKQWKDVWTLFDTDKDGKITKEEFVSAVRVLGRRYTTTQMEEKMRNFGNVIDWESYFGFLCDPYTGPTKEDLVNALRAFDGKDSGELTVAQISSLLTTMGDKMSSEEAAVVIKHLPVTHGKVRLEDLVTFFTPPVPSTNPNIEEILRDVMRDELRKANDDEKLMDTPPSPPPEQQEPATGNVPQPTLASQEMNERRGSSVGGDALDVPQVDRHADEISELQRVIAREAELDEL